MQGVVVKTFFSLPFVTLTLFSHLGFGASSSTLYFNNSKIETEKMASFLKNWPLPETSEGASSYVIVQFHGSSGLVRQKLERVSEVIRYVPHNGFIIKLKKDVSELEEIAGVEFVTSYSPYLKVEQDLLENSPEDFVVLDINVFPNENLDEIARRLAQFPIEILPAPSENLNGEVLSVRTQLKYVPGLSFVEGIEWIERRKEALLPGIPVFPSENINPAGLGLDTFNGYASGAKVLRPEKLYDMGIRGEGELIAFADSGLDLGDMEKMPMDLKGRVRYAMSLGRPETENWNDPLGHGTHVAGLLAGNGSSSQGHVKGVAFESTLMVQSGFKWMTQNGNLVKTLELPATLDSVFHMPYEVGAKIHSNSWHFFGDAYGVSSFLLDQFIWRHPDMVVVFAVGNNGVDLNGDGLVDESSIFSPSNAKNCISVGASENLIHRGGLQQRWGVIGSLGPVAGVNKWGALPLSEDLPSDHLDGLAAFSSRGPTSDGRIKPDLVAPGTNNLSLKSRVAEVSELDTWGTYNENYVFMGGTSMATPLVSGAVALVRQYYREVEKRETVSSALVKATLVNGAKDLFPGQFENFREIPRRRPNGHEGFGRVDLEAALLPTLPRVRRSIDYLEGISEGETVSWPLRVTNSQEPLRITLVYTDYPASPAVAKALVNDLDLSLENSVGSPFYPNGLSFYDRVNNVEQIDIDAPQVGKYVLRVFAPSIPFGYSTRGDGKKGRQPFALVVSGAFKMGPL